MQWIGLALVLLALLSVPFWVDPNEMDERHREYLAGYRVGYRGDHPGFVIGKYAEAFKTGWNDGAEQRQRDLIGK